MSEPHVLHLPEKYAAQVRALLQAHIPEAQVWAYGSRVRGDHYEASVFRLRRSVMCCA